MNQNKFSFESQKLEIDFITLSMQNSSNENNIQKLASYLFYSLGFNCFLSEGNTRRISRTLFCDFRTKDTAIIRINYWNKTVIEFPGKSGQKLYQLVKSQHIDWKFFHLPSLNLTRLDLCYDQKKTDFFDSLQFDRFLLDSRKQILKSTRTRNIKLINNNRGRILGINKRSNPRYFRVYESFSIIRFELEIKSLALEPIQAYFFNSQFNFFESQLTQFYFKYAKTLFPLDDYFVRWLLDFSRKYSLNENNTQSMLATEYFIEKSHLLEIHDYEKFYHLLQFLNFIKTLNTEQCPEYFLEGRKYFIQTLPLKDFMNFIGIPSTKQNQRLKIVEYFRQLHKTDPILEQFSDGTFRIFATFLYSGVYKKSNRWFVRVYIIEDLYLYEYPFILSNSFRNYKNQTDCLLKTQLIKAISVESIQKIFHLSEFIEQIKLSNKQIVKVKQGLIFLIQEIAQQGIIQSKLQIVYKNAKIQHLDQDQLNLTKLRQRIKYLIFYEKLN